MEFRKYGIYKDSKERDTVIGILKEIGFFSKGFNLLFDLDMGNLKLGFFRI